MKSMKTIRFYFYIAFALIVLCTSWSSWLTRASAQQAVIPHDAIRLRILANSNSPEDQWIKTKVRDVVVDRMNQWVREPKNIDEARSQVTAHLPEFRKVVADTLHEYGFWYDFKVELAVVPFPDKVYGNKKYPAGNYEALRITLGEAQGNNWWCVLFPPLCFVDLVTDEDKDQGKNTAAIGASAGMKGSVDAEEEEPKKKVRFFLWDLLIKLIRWIIGLFT